MSALRVACAALLFGGCTDGRTHEINHPTEVNLPPLGSPVIRAEAPPSGLSAELLQHWLDLRDSLLRDARIIASLGRLGATHDAPDVFGLAIDAALDDAMNIYVLDRLNSRVVHFGPRGEHLGDIGRAGSGPGEFQDPRTLALVSDGSMIVGDRGTRTLVFSPTDSGYVHVKTRTTGVSAEHMCSVHDRVFISGWSHSQIQVNRATGQVADRQVVNTVVHEVPVFGDMAVRSFGQGYNDDSWLIRSELSAGPIACLGDPVRVVFAFERIPVLRAYSASDGSLLWAARLEDYLQPPLVEYTREGQEGLGVSARVVQDIVMSLTPVLSRHLLLQTVRMPAREAGEETVPDDEDIEIRSYLIDAEYGQGAYISASLPLITTVGADYYVAKWLTPYPRLEVRKWGPRVRQQGD